VLDLLGGASVLGWGIAFSHVTVALLFGALAFVWLGQADLAGDRSIRAATATMLRGHDDLGRSSCPHVLTPSSRWPTDAVEGDGHAQMSFAGRVALVVGGGSGIGPGLR
jgi:hypothetical protein